LQSLEAGWLSAEAIEAGRITATHSVRGEGRLFIRVFPHKSVTAIPAETRMGKGKGEPEYWAAVIRPGMILYEIGGLPEPAARDALARVEFGFAEARTAQGHIGIKVWINNGDYLNPEEDSDAAHAQAGKVSKKPARQGKR